MRRTRELWPVGLIVVLLGVLPGCGRLGAPDGVTGSSLLQEQAGRAGQFEVENGRVRVLVGFTRPVGPDEKRLAQQAGGEIKRSFRHVPVMALSVPEAALQGLRNNPHVLFLEPDGGVQTLTLELENSASVVHIGAPAAHSSGFKGQGIRVAVVDTGVDYRHPDLAHACRGGYDFVNNDPDPMDDNGHGTHVAGVLVARSDGVGVVGVAPDAELYALKVLDRSGVGYWSDVIAALEWAMDNGIHIVNMSLGGGGSEALAAACQAACDRGLLLVAAAGNGGAGLDTVIAPARYPSVIAVAATDLTDVRATFSATGESIELAAPGVGVYSCLPGSGYGSMSGTSMACPHVAGAAALVWSGNPTWTGRDVRSSLRSTALDLGPAGRDNESGYGRVRTPGGTGDQGLSLSVVVSPAAAQLDGETTQVELIADPSGGTRPYAYQWSRDGSAVPGAIGPRLTVDRPGVYAVAVSDAAGRRGVSNEAIVTQVLPLVVEVAPSSTRLTASTPRVTLSAKVSGGKVPYAYQWHRNGILLAGATGATYATTEPGTYTVVVTDAEATSVTSVSAVVTASPGPTLHVAGVTMASANGRTTVSATARVRVVDEAGKPVSGATVTVRWADSTRDVHRTTNSRGEVTLRSSSVAKRAEGVTFGLCVVSVTKFRWIHDREADVETCATITVP